MNYTSKYIQLSSQILLEYRYTDKVASNAEKISTSNGARINFIKQPNNSTYIFNDNNPIYPGINNLFKRNAIEVGQNKFAYLTNKNALKFTDSDEFKGIFDDDILNSGPLSKDVYYDTIRLHFVSGFSFSEDDGFIFQVSFSDNNNFEHFLTSLTYLKTDSFETPNPKPFILGEKLYTNYIDIKIPSLKYLISDFRSNDPNSISKLMTNSIGISHTETIKVKVKTINSIESINGLTYFNVYETIETSLNNEDEYNTLTAVIQESINGDFFEMYGEFDNIIYEDFIAYQNTLPNTDLVVIHDIIVKEILDNGIPVQTSEQSFVQINKFDEPYRFRPIILNSHNAVSFRIEYTLRIYNKIDNSEIIRTSSLTSYDTKKYGRKFSRINLGTVPNITKIYNEIVNPDESILLDNSSNFMFNDNSAKTSDTASLPKTEIVKLTEYVTSFIETNNCSVSINNVKTKFADIEEGDLQEDINEIPLEIINSSENNKIYEQGAGIISINPFDNFIKFIFYNKIKNRNDETPELLDLIDLGTLYLNFVDSDGNEVNVKNYENVKELNKGNGEIVFKITKNESKKILKFENHDFYITTALDIDGNKTQETLLYSGKWVKSNDKFENLFKEQIAILENDLDNANNKLKSDTDKLNKKIEELNEIISNLKSENQLLIDNFSNLQTSIANLESSITTNMVNETKSNVINNIQSTTKQINDIKQSLNQVVVSKTAKEKFVSPNVFDTIKSVPLKQIKLSK